MTCDFKPPKIGVETLRFFKIWELVNTQWIMGFDGPIGLNFGSIATICESVGFDFDERLIRQLKVIEAEVTKRE